LYLGKYFNEPMTDGLSVFGFSAEARRRERGPSDIALPGLRHDQV